MLYFLFGVEAYDLFDGGGVVRSKLNQYPNTSLIQIEGINTKEEVACSSKPRELIMKILDKIEGKGGAISLPVVAALTVVFISMVYDARGIWTKDAVLNAADEVLMVNLVLKASLMGFALYLALLTYGFHKYIKGSRPLEAAKVKKSI